MRNKESIFQVAKTDEWANDSFPITPNVPFTSRIYPLTKTGKEDEQVQESVGMGNLKFSLSHMKVKIICENLE